MSSKWHSKSTIKGIGKDVKYEVNGKEYTVTIAVASDHYYIGYRSLMIFDSINIGEGWDFLHDFPIPDSILAPLGGWRLDELPTNFDRDKIEEYIEMRRSKSKRDW